jgi:hypothetical protein
VFFYTLFIGVGVALIRWVSQAKIPLFERLNLNIKEHIFGRREHTDGNARVPDLPSGG